MRNANEGISLAAIVAKETTTGKWNGTGGGIGLGTGGIGLFIGGVSGSKQEQTQRANKSRHKGQKTLNRLKRKNTVY